MTSSYPRDLIGYGRNPPHPQWPGGACLAVQFVINYEEGGENCILHGEGETAPKMMSVGLHCRLVGRPGRAAALARFLDYVQRHDRVWLCRRIDIARHWMAHHPYGTPGAMAGG
jgi:peptidoglycan/xylan/chitin deacetylase (PgdA/CDA1 family)